MVANSVKMRHFKQTTLPVTGLLPNEMTSATSDLDLMLSGDDLFHELQADLSLMDTTTTASSEVTTANDDAASSASGGSSCRTRSDSLYDALMGGDAATPLAAPPSQVFNEFVQNNREGESFACE